MSIGRHSRCSPTVTAQTGLNAPTVSAQLKSRTTSPGRRAVSIPATI